jgi:hypothetical protein
MQVSAEIRWFWEDPEAAAKWRDWFWSSGVFGGKPGGGKERVDEYLSDKGQTELGIKRRGGKPGLEMKGLVARGVGGFQLGSLSGSVDIWAKWSTESADLQLSQSLRIAKVRWARKWSIGGNGARELALGGDEQPLNAPASSTGCNLEFTEIRLPVGGPWWTLGFEAFGELSTVARSLELVVKQLGHPHAPEFPSGRCASYPAWIASLPK